MMIPAVILIIASIVFSFLGFVCVLIAIAGMHRDEDIIAFARTWWRKAKAWLLYKPPIELECTWNEDIGCNVIHPVEPCWFPTIGYLLGEWYRARNSKARIRDIETYREKELSMIGDDLAKKIDSKKSWSRLPDPV